MLKQIPKSLTLLVCAISLLFGLPALAILEIPDSIIKTPLLVREESVSAFVPSATAPGAGLVVNIIYPPKPRYKDGAPVAVIIPGGDGPEGLNFSAHTAQCGFIEVRFAFPGGGVKGLRSGGIYDYRGNESQEALRDILQFAAGKTTDTEGRHINELVPIKLLTNNVGLLGWSNGGNIALATMGKYPDKLRFISWVAFYESPIGTMFFPPNLGGDRDLVVNKHYRPGSCATGDCLVDYRKLAYDSKTTRGADQHKKRGEPVIPGILFFDENKNGIWDEPTEFAFSYAVDVGLDKQIYPPDVTAAMARFEIFKQWIENEGPYAKKKDKNGKSLPDPDQDTMNTKQIKAREKLRVAKTIEWEQEMAAKQEAEKNPNVKIERNRYYERKEKWPVTVAMLAESEAYYQERDGSQFIDTVCAKYPWLLVTVFGSSIDHMQRQMDHPHISLLYNAFLADKAHWVRLNPDPSYVGFMATMNGGNFTNNKPNAPIDASSIADQLEPEGMVPEYLYMDAACAELADRTKSKDPIQTITEVLHHFPYGAGPMLPVDQTK